MSDAQKLLATFCHEVIPKLNALGPVGVLCQQRLAAMMHEVGLADGAPEPPSLAAVLTSATHALAAIKRYATSGMLAPVLAPRSRRTTGASEPAHHGGMPPPARQASGSSTGGAPPSNTGMFAPMSGLMALPGTLDGGGHESVDEASIVAEDGADGGPKLHACKNCQRAKTACNDQRPCARCVRLGVPCDGDMRAVKRAPTHSLSNARPPQPPTPWLHSLASPRPRPHPHVRVPLVRVAGACAACKRSKVKCDLDDRHPDPCSRCTRLGLCCTPHVPNKKTKKGVDRSGGDAPEGEACDAVAALPMPSPVDAGVATATGAAELPKPFRFSLGDGFTLGGGMMVGGGHGSSDSLPENVMLQSMSLQSPSLSSPVPNVGAPLPGPVPGALNVAVGAAATVSGAHPPASSSRAERTARWVGATGRSGTMVADQRGVSMARSHHSHDDSGRENSQRNSMTMDSGRASMALSDGLVEDALSAFNESDAFHHRQMEAAGLLPSPSTSGMLPAAGMMPNATVHQPTGLFPLSGPMPSELIDPIGLTASGGLRGIGLSTGSGSLAVADLRGVVAASAGSLHSATLSSGCLSALGSQPPPVPLPIDPARTSSVGLGSAAGSHHASSSGGLPLPVPAALPAMAAVPPTGGVPFSAHPTGQPLVSQVAAVSASGWQPVHSDGDITVTVQSLRGRALWRVVANVPTPPSAAAAGMRQLWRTWGHGDSVVPSVIVLQEGGAVPSTVTDCACCFEQLLQALCVGPPEVGGVDFLLRSVWTIYQGQHTAAIRSTAEVRAAQVPGSRHEEISVSSRAALCRDPCGCAFALARPRSADCPVSACAQPCCVACACSRLPNCAHLAPI